MKIIGKIIVSLLIVILIPSSLAFSTQDDLPDDIKIDEFILKDQLEVVNRKIFTFNQALDASLFRFTSIFYHKVTPVKKMRFGISNIISNLNEPRNMVTHLFYGNLPGFFRSSARFLVNTTLGLGGFFDVAENKGVVKQNLDFSQFLAGRLCWKNGNYLIIPVLGPSTSRNAFGFLVDRLIIDPLNYLLPLPLSFSKLLLEIILLKESQFEIMQEIKKVSLDEYTALLSLYSQSYWAKEYNDSQEIKNLFDKL